MAQLTYKVKVHMRWWGRFVWPLRGVIRHLPGVRWLAIKIVKLSLVARVR